MATDPVGTHSKIPGALTTFRNREAKVLGVSLVMSGIILLMALVPITNVVASSLVNSGAPIITSLLFTLSGVLTILLEHQPRRLLGQSAMAGLVLSAGLGAAELVVILVDISRLRGVPAPCPINLNYPHCHWRSADKRLLASSMPAVYLLTLTGILLCAALSIILHEFLRDWGPTGGRTRTSDGPPEEESLVPVDHGIDPGADPSPPQGGPGQRDRVTPRSPETAKTSLLVEKFLESQPKILGVILLTSSFGIVLLAIPDMVLSHIGVARLALVWWSFVQSVVSGVLSIVAAGNPTVPLIRSCLALNILSATVSGVVSLGYLDLTGFLVICITFKCEDPALFTQHLFPFLLLLLSLVISSVLAAYARKALRSLSLDKTTLIVNPTSIQEQ